ncbi:MAG: 1-acyl-sn-glycerol-3-phosphate acyltransferase [Opitutae bacterium]|nr:1-acyl-sn-glycerol-3-phosphate acyltransferase [Opitutae bacterium]
MFFRSVLHLLGYYLSLVVFGAFGLTLSLFSLLAGGLPATPATERFFQRLIHRHLAVFVWWAGFSRMLRVHYHGLDRLSGRPCVLVANHPGLMDITYLLARVPEAVCIFKPAIRRNPVLGAAARRAGYLASDGGHDLVRAAGAKVAAGHTLVVFPEGTRTPPGVELGPFKPGFALIAQRARVPVQLVHIGWNTNVLVKGRAWWRLPRLPGRVDITVGPCLAPAPGRPAAALAAEAEAWFRARAVAGDTACLRPRAAVS